MFESNNQQLNQNNVLSSDYQVSSSQEEAMSYMPEKFLKPESDSKGGNLFFKIGIVLLVLAVLSVGGFALYIFKFRDVTKQSNENSNVLDLEKNSTTTEENSAKLYDLNTQEGRDKKRFQDISDLISALSIYFKDNKVYPESLSNLSGMISQMPVNPTPGGEDYNYFLSSDKKSYKLTFSFENEVQVGNLIFKSGKYQVDSSGIIKTYEDDIIDNPDNQTVDKEDQYSSNTLPIPPKGADSDNDDLTNVEEFLFGSEIDREDTDGDTYLDGNEVANLYDLLSATGKLADNINIVKVFYNESQNYSILYPAKWMAENKTADFKETVFYDDKNGDFFKIQVYENPQNLNLKSWYLSFAPGMKAEDLIDFNGKTLHGISTKDGLNIYYSSGDKVYAISYIITSETELNYYTTFLMFSRSFRPMK